MCKITKINNILGLDLVTTCNNIGCTVHEVNQYVGIKYNGRNVLNIRVNKYNQLLLDVRESNLTTDEKMYFNAHVMPKCQWTLNCRTITTRQMTLIELLIVVLAKEIIA